jgi:hypothetical protein
MQGGDGEEGGVALLGARLGGGVRGMLPRVRTAPKAVVPPNLANLPMPAFRIMVSADLDNLGGHPHHRCHHSPTCLQRRHEHAAP